MCKHLEITGFLCYNFSFNIIVYMLYMNLEIGYVLAKNFLS